jgi:hypothetical protein
MEDNEIHRYAVYLGHLGGTAKHKRLSKEVRTQRAKNAGRKKGLKMNNDRTLPTQEDLMKKAVKTPISARFVIASDYLDVIKELRDNKKLTWLEIARWFKAQEIPLSKAAVTSAYHNSKS